MINVVVSGALGRMGSMICEGLEAQDDICLVAGVDPFANENAKLPGNAMLYKTLEEALAEQKPDAVIDFTRPDVAEKNVSTVLEAGVNMILGTTGLSEDKLQSIYDEHHTGSAALFHAPNFTTGAVLMMLFSQTAAKYFSDVEVIELHHNGKKDAPSGTAIRTAKMIASAKQEESQSPSKETELEGFEGARGALVDGVPVHSLRGSGFVANQEVIFGSPGQTLAIRHDSIDRTSYLPGILLAVRSIKDLQGCVIGLEKLMIKD